MDFLPSWCKFYKCRWKLPAFKLIEICRFVRRSVVATGNEIRRRHACAVVCRCTLRFRWSASCCWRRRLSVFVRRGTASVDQRRRRHQSERRRKRVFTRVTSKPTRTGTATWPTSPSWRRAGSRSSSSTRPTSAARTCCSTPRTRWPSSTRGWTVGRRSTRCAPRTTRYCVWLRASRGPAATRRTPTTSPRTSVRAAAASPSIIIVISTAVSSIKTTTSISSSRGRAGDRTVVAVTASVMATGRGVATPTAGQVTAVTGRPRGTSHSATAARFTGLNYATEWRYMFTFSNVVCSSFRSRS